MYVYASTSIETLNPMDFCRLDYEIMLSLLSENQIKLNLYILIDTRLKTYLMNNDYRVYGAMKN